MLKWAFHDGLRDPLLLNTKVKLHTSGMNLRVSTIVAYSPSKNGKSE